MRLEGFEPPTRGLEVRLPRRRLTPLGRNYLQATGLAIAARCVGLQHPAATAYTQTYTQGIRSASHGERPGKALEELRVGWHLDARQPNGREVGLHVPPLVLRRAP